MYNSIEYSNNHYDTSESLRQIKREEKENNANVTIANSSSFKYKSNFVDNTDNNGNLEGVKIAFLLKYSSNFWRPLEMPLINSKVELSLKWIENCILPTSINIENDATANAAKATFKITDAKLYVPVVLYQQKTIQN